MSRSPIPGSKNKELKAAFKQICVYSFPRSVLERFISWGTKGYFEEIEDIEILRFIEKGIRVKMLGMDPNTIAVDTPDDLRRLKLVLETQGEGIAAYSI
jgi:3-deoxy-manno-octulosonate cytidylyltransferase (CMP-KDO synthetase)